MERSIAGPARVGAVSIEVSPDRMQAYLSLRPEEAAGANLYAEVVSALHEAGVRFGIRHDEIIRALDSGSTTERVLIAEGEAPEEGKDARVAFAFDPAPAFRPREREDGSVDHREVLMIAAVEEGDVVARIVPAVPGRAGILVDGRVLPNHAGHDRVRIVAGENVEEREGGRTFVARLRGHPVWDGWRVSVLPVFTIEGDVDGATGNVRFEGGLIVRGWVRQGFVVRARGDVEVLGGIEGGDVASAEGSVWVHGGVRGGARVRAAKDVVARFVEASEATALRDAVLGDAALHAEISAGRAVHATEGRGLILGGVVRAQETISARVLGSWSDKADETQVRIEHVRAKEILAEIVEFERRVRSVEAAARRLETLMRSYPSEVERGGVRPRLQKAIEVLRSHRENFLREKQMREATLGAVRGGEIVALQRIHPGVTVSIGQRSLHIDRRTAGCTFFREGGEIRWA